MKILKFLILPVLLIYSNNLSAEIDVSNFFSNLIPGEGHTEASVIPSPGIKLENISEIFSDKA